MFIGFLSDYIVQNLIGPEAIHSRSYSLQKLFTPEPNRSRT